MMRSCLRCSTLARVAARRATAFAAVPRGSFGGWLSWLLNWVSGPRTAKHAFAFCVVPCGRVACPWAWLVHAKHTRDPPRVRRVGLAERGRRLERRFASGRGGAEDERRMFPLFGRSAGRESAERRVHVELDLFGGFHGFALLFGRDSRVHEVCIAFKRTNKKLSTCKFG